uniref:Reverse transcriptase domain-containing protein n=1 Tax=Cannabis sativa TaxID=3483 RepID=A0A803P956_CANSA
MDKAISPLQAAFIHGRLIVDATLLGQEVVNTAIKRIMVCVTSTSYAVLLNGKPLKKCLPSRNLWQDDPISPFLFLCFDVLSRLLQRAEEKGDIKGISIACCTTPISHLMFADDTMEKEIEDELQTKITEVGGFYLGNPMLLSKNKSNEFSFVIDKLKSKLEGWRLRTLSYSGRLVAINSVALALPVYSMSTFLLPVTVCRQMDALVRRFWWTGGNEEKIWVKVFREKFCSWESFWAVRPRIGDPSIWKGILEARDLILDGTCTIIANGRDINIWWQPWISWMSYVEFCYIMEQVKSRPRG